MFEEAVLPLETRQRLRVPVTAQRLTLTREFSKMASRQARAGIPGFYATKSQTSTNSHGAR